MSVVALGRELQPPQRGTVGEKGGCYAPRIQRTIFFSIFWSGSSEYYGVLLSTVASRCISSRAFTGSLAMPQRGISPTSRKRKMEHGQEFSVLTELPIVSAVPD